jgi:hypothetical protein
MFGRNKFATEGTDYHRKKSVKICAFCGKKISKVNVTESSENLWSPDQQLYKTNIVT